MPIGQNGYRLKHNDDDDDDDNNNNNGKVTCTFIDVAISGKRNVIEK